MCDLDEGDWPEYVLHLERALARRAEPSRGLWTELQGSSEPVGAEA